ncbi:hypothetical protein NPIL_508141 [Nephila pilipes]|uniref:Uncharacterized protein n=1 Tax=Nephila pilipes TaxID=299642 RepID=A0A8X6U1Z1_NEPPI|nr:hypothetical protein NPIL_508141 [Nephila pilipes]
MVTDSLHPNQSEKTCQTSRNLSDCLLYPNSMNKLILDPLLMPDPSNPAYSMSWPLPRLIVKLVFLMFSIFCNLLIHVLKRRKRQLQLALDSK